MTDINDKVAQVDPEFREATASKLLALQPDQLVADRYKVISLLGEGGMGAVYEVEQVFLKRRQALKTLNFGGADTAWRRFQKEAKAASLLDHRNLVRVHDFGLLEESHPFFVMDLAEGENLATIVKRGPMSIEMFLEIFSQVCAGLDYAHKKGVVHRDIKPSNIMVANFDKPGQVSVKIVDFGIAKHIGIDDPASLALTRTGEIFGTPYYMSPEQCLGAAVDDRSDIYSVGCVMYEVLTGLPPFIGDSALSTMMKHSSEKPLSLKEATLGKVFPEDLERMISKLLEKEPRSRYRSLAEVATDLRLIAEGEPVLLGGSVSTSTSAAETAVQNRHWNRTVFALVFLLAGSLGFGIGRLTGRFAPEHHAEPPVVDRTRVGDAIMQLYVPEKLPPPPKRFSTEIPDSPWQLFRFGENRLGRVAWLDGTGVALVPSRGLFIKASKPDLCGDVLINHRRFAVLANETLRRNAAYFRAFLPEEVMAVDFDSDCANLTDDDLKYLDHLQNLEILRMVMPNSLDGHSIDTINKFPLLLNLGLRCSALKASDVLRLERLREVDSLELDDLKDCNPVLEKLAGSKKLRVLILENCQIGSNLQCIANVKTLKRLLLHNNPVSDSDLKCLQQLPKLEELGLVGCSKLTSACFVTLRQLPLKTLRWSAVSAAEEQRVREQLPGVDVKFQTGHHNRFKKEDLDLLGQ